MALPRVVITGASGFLGRHILAVMKERYRIYALARRSQRNVRAPVHPNISWHQADIGVSEPLGSIFRTIEEEGGAEILIHLAAFYDFTGEEHPEYWRTNVDGLRNVLELSKRLGLKRFLFASSVAACPFPPPGESITEETPATGQHIYAVTKRVGEEMCREYRDHFPTTIVRLAALFSDYCEYAPYFAFLKAWLSEGLVNRVLAGRGQTAIPNLHIRDAVGFFVKVVEEHDAFEPGEVLLASTNGSTTHLQLFEAATLACFGKARNPILVPRSICTLGLWGKDILGRILGDRSFERPWMGKYIDTDLRVDASLTRKRLNWRPNPRLHILRRMPFLVENYKADPVEWSRRNQAAMKRVRISRHLRIHQVLETREAEIAEGMIARLTAPTEAYRFASYQKMPGDELLWAVNHVLRQLRSAIRTRDKAVFRVYGRDLGERRFRQGFPCGEVCDALGVMLEIAEQVLVEDPLAKGLEEGIRDYVVMTIRLGIDEVQDVYEELTGKYLTPEETLIPELSPEPPPIEPLSTQRVP